MFENENVTQQPAVPVALPQQESLEEAVEAQELVEKVGVDEIRKATEELLKYKNGKLPLENRVIENEQWFKLRHWEYIREENENQVEPVSAWLFNSLANKHADAMDNIPMANILPREENDKESAEELTSIVPVVMEQTDFEQVYSDYWDDKIRGGTGIAGVFWAPEELYGLGNVVIKRLDVLNLFWKPGVEDVQKSPNFFIVEAWDKDELEAAYPKAKGKLTGSALTISKYHKEDQVETEQEREILVIDWYYKRRVGKRRVLHYCKYVGETVLYASENDPKYAQRGWYDHGEYPVVFDPMWKVKGSPCGFGYIDLGKSAQEYIDEVDQDLKKNLHANARPRYFAQEGSNVNLQEFTDLNCDIVHYTGSPEGLIPIKGAGLGGVYVNIHQNKVAELKETTGTRDVSTGGTPAGITAASAVAALQEAAGKLSRDANKAAYRAYRKIVKLVVELIRQFFTTERCFRITGKDGKDEFKRYSNKNIQMQSTGREFGTKETFRLPLFDISISCQKQSPYSKMSQNELALQFYNAGFFDPGRAQQAMACLEMMDFERKQFVMNQINENGLLFQQLQQAMQKIAMLSEMVEKLTNRNISGGGMPAGGAPATEGGRVNTEEALGAKHQEAGIIRRARQQAAETTAPT